MLNAETFAFTVFDYAMLEHFLEIVGQKLDPAARLRVSFEHIGEFPFSHGKPPRYIHNIEKPGPNVNPGNSDFSFQPATR